MGSHFRIPEIHFRLPIPKGQSAAHWHGRSLTQVIELHSGTHLKHTPVASLFNKRQKSLMPVDLYRLLIPE